MSEELTPWHDGSVKPDKDGVYEVRDHDGSAYFHMPSYAYFNIASQEWTTATEFYMAHKKYIGFCPGQNKQWRGLANKPKTD